MTGGHGWRKPYKDDSKLYKYTDENVKTFASIASLQEQH